MRKTEIKNDNPFFEIMHKGDEKIIMSPQALKKIKELSKELVKNHPILFIVGDHGSGKSLVEKEIEKNIPKKFEKRKLIFTIDLLSELRALPIERMLKKRIVIYIDKFELTSVIDDGEFEKLLDVIYDTSKSGVGYVISCHPDTLARIFDISDKIRMNSRVYNVPSLTFEQAKKLIISRLNMVRKKKSNSLNPFTESQIRNIWKTSRGNPRMILLLCANLYNIVKR